MCKVCVNGFFYPTDTLPKLKVYKAFILHPGLMHCLQKQF